jgi:transcriptional regulator with GAF, ATPase, and Fis domain
MAQPAGPPHAVVAWDRLEFETLISNTSASLMEAAPHEVQPVIEAALGHVRTFFRADRCSLLTVGADRSTVSVFAASYASGMVQVSGDINLTELFPWTSRRLVVEGVATVIPRMADLPPEAAVDGTTWASLSTLSSMTVPIFTGATVSHVMAMATVSVERAWPAEYVPRLRVLGELMAAALHRKQSFESLEQALDEVKRLRDRLERENVYLRREVAQQVDGHPVVGRSAAIRQALELSAQVAVTNSTVLLVGETGTGKERFATYIHQASQRHDHHMVRVNCSAIPTALIESELFGREKGAYTGALSKQIGRFELAHKSTLFLDEIGDLPLEVQIKLLRVLEERTIERLGSPTPIDIDVRIIVATNRDLEAAVRDGTFRSDLYYRLNVFPIVVPPLRERREDIPELADALVEDLSRIMRKRIDAIERASIEALQRYDWPGNVRELRNILERAMILAAGPTLTVALPHAAVSASPAVTTPGSGELRGLEREHILRVLEDTGWRIRGHHAAAEVLGLKPTTLEARMTKLGINRPAAHPHL